MKDRKYHHFIPSYPFAAQKFVPTQPNLSQTAQISHQYTLFPANDKSLIEFSYRLEAVFTYISVAQCFPDSLSFQASY
jgi:hypothetical protein